MNPNTKANIIVALIVMGLFMWGWISGFNNGQK